MTLVITAIAAGIVGSVRLGFPTRARDWSLGVLALIYLGAALMWLVDGLRSLGAGGPFLDTSPEAMRSESLLGACVVGLGLIAWLVFCLVRRRRHP
ncbi:MAG: hypothetical protein LBE83_03480 [Propionibacteriaceae bacterium]|jgi:hypothetical protein|nr:hypothetical protein [Propionibacteriaceae bacterium]